MEILVKLLNATANGNTLYLSLYSVLHKISGGYAYVFEVKLSNGNSSNHVYDILVEAGSRKSKMAASKLELVMSQHAHKIATRFQRLCLCCMVQQSNETSSSYVQRNRKKPEVENLRWRPPNLNLYLSLHTR